MAKKGVVKKMDQATSVAVVIAIVETVKRYVPTLTGGLTVLLAAGVGAVLGYLGVNGLDLVSGIVAGLTAVGVHTTVSAVKQ